MRLSPQALFLAAVAFLAGLASRDVLLPPPPAPTAAAPAAPTGAAAPGPLRRMRFPADGEPRRANETLLILSPVRNRGSSHRTPISHFVALIQGLTFPRSRTSVALLEGDSDDDTWPRMQEALAPCGKKPRAPSVPREVSSCFFPFPSPFCFSVFHQGLQGPLDAAADP